MQQLTKRNKAGEEELAVLEELEKTTPDAASMPQALLTAKESMTQQAANRVNEFEELWKKTKSRTDAHISMSTKEDVGVGKTLQEVLIKGAIQCDTILQIQYNSFVVPSFVRALPCRAVECMKAF